MSEPVTAEEMQDVVDGLKDAKRDAQCLLTNETFDELIHFCSAGVAALHDRDAGWSAAEKLCESLREIAKGFDDDGYLYNRDEVLKVVAWYTAAKAARGTA